MNINETLKPALAGAQQALSSQPPPLIQVDASGATPMAATGTQSGNVFGKALVQI